MRNIVPAGALLLMFAIASFLPAEVQAEDGTSLKFEPRKLRRLAFIKITKWELTDDFLNRPSYSYFSIPSAQTLRDICAGVHFPSIADTEKGSHHWVVTRAQTEVMKRLLWHHGNEPTAESKIYYQEGDTALFRIGDSNIEVSFSPRLPYFPPLCGLNTTLDITVEASIREGGQIKRGAKGKHMILNYGSVCIRGMKENDFFAIRVGLVY